MGASWLPEKAERARRPPAWVTAVPDAVQPPAFLAGGVAYRRHRARVESAVPSECRRPDRGGPCDHDRASLRFAVRLRAAWVHGLSSHTTPSPQIQMPSRSAVYIMRRMSTVSPSTR